jgi:hypothetical protein
VTHKEVATHRLRIALETVRCWIEYHFEELHHLYASQDIIRMMISRRIRRVRHIARMGEKISVYRILARNLMERYHS